MKYIFTCRSITDTVVVPGELIDEYMKNASGEYIKIYLYILRHANMELAAEDIADALNVTEGDVERAISYWERAEAILKIGVKRKNNSEDSISEVGKDSVNIPEGIVSNLSKSDIPSRIDVNTEKLKDDEAFSSLVYSSQKYLGKIFKQTDLEIFAYMYDVLKIPVEVLEYIVELTAQKGKKSVRYVEAIALDFHAKGITTIAQAKADSTLYTGEVYGVMKNFGISKREPSSDELKYINKWFKMYGFSKEIVFEACDRTIRNVGNPNFPYADKILTNLYVNKVKEIKDIEKLDERHNEINEKSRVQNDLRSRKKTTFNNIAQRDTDINSRAIQRLKEKLKEEEGNGTK